MSVPTLLTAAVLSLFGCRSKHPPETSTAAPGEHAVIVQFQYGLPDLTALRAVEDGLERAIAAARVGDFDGDEIAVDLSDGFLYMYGPSGDALFATVKPVLEGAAFMRGAVVTVRYGPPGARQTTARLGAVECD